MKRIIFVSDLTIWSMGKGHGGPAFSQTIKKYIDKNWEVYLISDEVSNKNYSNLDENHNIIIKPSIFKKYIGLRKIGIFFKILDHISATKQYKKKLEEIIKNDEGKVILYAYEIFGVRACAKLAKKYNIPLVTRFQGTILSQYTNSILNHLKLYPHYQALSEEANLVIMTDDGTKGKEVLQNLNNNSKTLFLRNGLDLMDGEANRLIEQFEKNKFRKAIANISDEECMFLTVSRLVSWKKVERAIYGFAEYCNRGMDGKLVIVGDGSDKENLMNIVKELGLSEKVVFTGAIPHEKVYDYMLACDVFLSLYDLSNVGNPLLEAMALGKCIVTLDVGDTKKLIANGENGILMKMDEINQLGDVLVKLVNNKELRVYLEKNARRYAIENFYTWDKRMDIEYKAVNSLIENKHLQRD